MLDKIDVRMSLVFKNKSNKKCNKYKTLMEDIKNGLTKWIHEQDASILWSCSLSSNWSIDTIPTNILISMYMYKIYKEQQRALKNFPDTWKRGTR